MPVGAAGRAAAASPATAIAAASESGNATRRSTPPSRMPERAAATRGRDSGQTAEHGAEERVPPRRLRERAAIREERRDAGLAPSGVVAVDEEAERIERQMLGDRHPERELPRADRQSRPRLVEGETESRAVDGMDRRGPSLASAARASRPCRAPRRRSSRSRGRVGPAAPAPPRPPPPRRRLSLSEGGWPSLELCPALQSEKRPRLRGRYARRS